MNKGTGFILVLGVLAFAGAWHFQNRAPEAPGVAPSPPEPSKDEGRFAAYQAQLDSLAAVDDAIVIYRESEPVNVPGLESLRAIAVDSEDRLYAGGGTNVVVLSATGEVLRRLAVEGEVSCLAVDGKHRLYVGLGSAVHAFEADGRRTDVFEGLGDAALVTSIAATEDDVFVADAHARAVMRYSPAGARKLTIDGRVAGEAETGFVVPSPCFDVMLGEGSVLWVANPGHRRLEAYDFDGVRIDAWDDLSGSEIEKFCGCCNPAHIARRRDGAIVTAEKGFRRVKVYTRRGQFLGVVAGPDQFADHEATLDIAVDSRDRVLVADPAHVQIRVFEAR
jgi:sugar lactone lactonase YvrE